MNFFKKNDLLDTRAKQENHLISVIKNELRKDSCVILPVPSFGHSQEVLKIIDNAMLSNILPQVPIYVDGSINIVFPLFERQFQSTRRTFVSKNVKITKRNTELSDIAKGSRIIIASPKNYFSEYSRSFQLIRTAVEKKLNTVVLSLSKIDTYYFQNNLSSPVKEILDQTRIHYYRIETHLLPSHLFKLISVLKPQTTVLVHSDVKDDISTELSNIHPLEYPRSSSIVQSINKMPIYL